ncbi:endonuclease [Dinoroseobacter phage vB_DshS-R5C]|uniref:Uncharacterized protein n=1 Tax=Dinoroseobacter phage vB_DshS-R5C TaxID=1965368 RepID=A0A1V0DY97_9CAUD|nr:endonuclease [Dinoroseobacter phage vB_DshS-R5C]ARB06144.1 hypothetical protein vBDshSR5C_90 [Dinoroseobacter phage vB_DshS-R5C]
MREWRTRDPVRALLASAKKSAKIRGIEFSLVREDVKIPARCPIFAIPLRLGKEGLGACRDAAPSIDRIDSSKGYVRGNIVVVSFKANRIKSNASADEVLKVGRFYKELTTNV